MTSLRSVSSSGSCRAIERFSGLSESTAADDRARWRRRRGGPADRHHVMRVIVAGILGERALQVVKRVGFVSGVERDRGSVDPFVGVFGAGPSVRARARNFQVEPGTFEQLALIGIALNDGAQRVGGRGEVAALQRLQPALVHRHGFVIGRLSRRRLTVRRRRWRDRLHGLDRRVLYRHFWDRCLRGCRPRDRFLRAGSGLGAGRAFRAGLADRTTALDRPRRASLPVGPVYERRSRGFDTRRVWPSRRGQ